MKYNVGDVVWLINYFNRRLEISVIHEVIPYTNQYKFGMYDFIRKEEDLYTSKEEAQIKLDEYLKVIGGNK